MQILLHVLRVVTILLKKFSLSEPNLLTLVTFLKSNKKTHKILYALHIYKREHAIMPFIKKIEDYNGKYSN
ncbi:MAG: hypothetical protein RL113_653 [Pseudomonadota bacterium]